MWCWDFVGPKLTGPSCAYADVYAHLGDIIWRNRFDGYVWLSEMDDHHLRKVLKTVRSFSKGHPKKKYLPYLEKNSKFERIENLDRHP